MPGGVTGHMYIIHCQFISLLRKSSIITVDTYHNF